MDNYSIAVVDDNPVSLREAKELLTDANMHVDCISTGKDLLKYLEKNSPDIILLDIMMSEVDGFDTYIMIRRFEELAGRRNIPVIFTAEKDDKKAEEMGLILGASDYIKKPFGKDVLLLRIQRSIESSRTIDSLQEEASIDRLTDLYNKKKGTDRVTKLCQRKKGALMIMDLDSFKLVNDIYGHDKGDLVLKAFADIGRKNSREEDTLCRIGGDEFMAFYENFVDERAAISLTSRLNSQLQERAKTILGENHGIPLGISIGIVMVPEFGRDYEGLFAKADSALYKVKHNGKHGYAIYGTSESDSGNTTESPEEKLNRMIQILEERNNKSGALFIGKDFFAAIYKYVMRVNRRHQSDSVVILFELDILSDDMQYVMDAESTFGTIVEKNLRMSDIMVQDGSRSFMVVLVDCNKDAVEEVISRVKQSYNETECGKNINVTYVYKFKGGVHA